MNDDLRSPIAQYRLRFLLQEYDLPDGETLIGRGDECAITIHDPHISRRHARIGVTGHGAWIEDLGSRNGCRVNGAQVRGSQTLTDGDRIRIGTQELVFIESVTFELPRNTGSLCICVECRLPYPQEMGACPNCGSNRSTEDTADDVLASSRRLSESHR